MLLLIVVIPADGSHVKWELYTCGGVSMAKRNLWGALLEKDLSGVDDPVVVNSIGLSCYRQSRLTSSLRPSDLVILGSIIAINTAAVAIADVLAWRGWYTLLTSGMAGAPTVYLAFKWLRRRMMDVLPHVLRSMGRCTHCGYKLEGEQSTCPECGHSADDSVDSGVKE